MSFERGTAAATVIERGRGNVWAAYRTLPRSERLRVAACVGYLVVLTLVFIRPLMELMAYAAGNDLQSYIILVPFISAYLLFLRCRQPVSYRSSITGVVIGAAIGLSAAWASLHWSPELTRNDGLALMTVAFVILVLTGVLLFLGSAWIGANMFPIAFLFFLIPLPEFTVKWLENALMLASAEAAALYFRIWGVAVFRNGTVFELPRITLQVAQECSGIHSSWALFITSVLTSHILLRSRWRKAVLVAFVIPLGILRNGFRILVIGWLCVNVGPEMIDSPIHHRGGPIFFVLSLVPLVMLLWWLRGQERTRAL